MLKSWRDLEKTAIENKLYRKNLISIDGQTAAILVTPLVNPEDEGLRRRLIENTKKNFAALRKTGHAILYRWCYKHQSLSQPVFTRRHHDFCTSDLSTCYSCYLVLFQKYSDSLTVPGQHYPLCGGRPRGLMGLTGVEINNVTVIVIPLVMGPGPE